MDDWPKYKRLNNKTCRKKAQKHIFMNLDPARISYTVHKKHNHIIIKERIDKLGFIKMKKFCSSEDTNNRVKRQIQVGRRYLQYILTKDSLRI